MKNCTDCIYADWERTASGKLHPKGAGRCTKTIVVPPLPQSFYWSGNPAPVGGWINRRKELRDHCTYFTRKASTP